MKTTKLNLKTMVVRWRRRLGCESVDTKTIKECGCQACKNVISIFVDFSCIFLNVANDIVDSAMYKAKSKKGVKSGSRNKNKV